MENQRSSVQSLSRLVDTLGESAVIETSFPVALLAFLENQLLAIQHFLWSCRIICRRNNSSCRLFVSSSVLSCLTVASQRITFHWYNRFCRLAVQWSSSLFSNTEVITPNTLYVWCEFSGWNPGLIFGSCVYVYSIEQFRFYAYFQSRSNFSLFGYIEMKMASSSRYLSNKKWWGHYRLPVLELTDLKM